MQWGHIGGVGGGAGVNPDLLAFSSEFSGCLNLLGPAKPREGTLPQGGALLDQLPPSCQGSTVPSSARQLCCPIHGQEPSLAA